MNELHAPVVVPDRQEREQRLAAFVKRKMLTRGRPSDHVLGSSIEPDDRLPKPVTDEPTIGGNEKQVTCDPPAGFNIITG
jgi:hypothetical protein